jgi:hypothetical protein
MSLLVCLFGCLLDDVALLVVWLNTWWCCMHDLCLHQNPHSLLISDLMSILCPLQKPLLLSCLAVG